jgi:hypothetical protein
MGHADAQIAMKHQHPGLEQTGLPWMNATAYVIEKMVSAEGIEPSTYC